MHTSAGIAIAAALVAACHPPRPAYIGVRGSEVRAHLDELRRDGQAQIPTVMVKGKVIVPADVETVFLAQTVTVGKTTTSLEALADGCEGATAGDCGLVRLATAPVKLRELAPAERKEPDHGNGPALIAGGLALGAVGGMVYCIAECTSNKGLKSMGLGLGAALLGLVSYVLAGGTIRD